MPLVVRDDLGRTITLRGPARRILSLSPAIAENVFAVGAGARLVGRTSVDNYPAAVTKLPVAGDFGQPSYERIVALKPDLAIVEIAKVDRRTVENAERRMGIPILVQTSVRYADVPRHLRQIGQITGQGPTAETVARKMEATAKQIGGQLVGRERVKVFVEISDTPLYAAGPGNFIDDLIRLAGGVNIVRGTNPFPLYGKESLLVGNPDVYIVAGGGTVGGRSSRTLTPPLGRIRAAQTGSIYQIPADFLFRPTPRLAEGLRLMARFLSAAS